MKSNIGQPKSFLVKIILIPVISMVTVIGLSQISYGFHKVIDYIGFTLTIILFSLISYLILVRWESLKAKR
jgi:hypothetical protein